MNYEAVTAGVLEELKEALGAVSTESTEKFLEEIENANQVFFVGVGRVLLSLKAMAKRFAHLGVNCHIVGDITEPAITPEDVLVVGSGSGESLFPVAIAKKAKSLGARVVMIGSNTQSTLAGIADLVVRIPVQTKLDLPGEIPSRQPMTSLFEQSLLLYGDVLAAIMIEKKGIEMKSLWRCHANLE